MRTDATPVKSIGTLLPGTMAPLPAERETEAALTRRGEVLPMFEIWMRTALPPALSWTMFRTV
jgi:hypothetical protein